MVVYSWSVFGDYLRLARPKAASKIATMLVEKHARPVPTFHWSDPLQKKFDAVVLWETHTARLDFVAPSPQIALAVRPRMEFGHSANPTVTIPEGKNPTTNATAIVDNSWIVGPVKWQLDPAQPPHPIG